MSTDGQGIKWRRNIAKNFNRLSWVHVYVTDRQTDRRQTTDDDIANVNVAKNALSSNIEESFKLLIVYCRMDHL